MDTYKEETKKVYEERLKGVQSNINKIEEYEKLGGPLIPQGTVVYNDTGKEIKARITSYADPNWIGVYAPSDQFQEGQQDLYSYDASAFGHMALISKKYVELGTPLGQAIFNADEGFLEYAALLPNVYKLDQKGKVIYDTLNNKNKINEKIPEYFGDPLRGMNYDITHDLSWGVDVDRNDFSNPRGKWQGGGIYFYSVYSNLTWLAGYNYNNIRELEKQKKLVEIITYYSFNAINNKQFYGSMQIINNNVYLGNLIFYGENELKGKPVYIFVTGIDSLLWKNTNNWKYYEPQNKMDLYQEEEKIYKGVPSFFGLPYSYDWAIDSDKEENLWIDIYPIQKDKVIKRILLKDLKIGEIIKEFIEKNKIKRKLDKIPEVTYIRFISDDINGLIYFDVKLDMEYYDFAPLIIAIDRDGNLKLLARLWSAAGDKKAITASAKMGPGFYDYRAVLTANGDIFTIWNGSKGVAIGKLEAVR